MMNKYLLIFGMALVLSASNCSKSKTDACTGSAVSFQLNEPFLLCWDATAKQAGQPDFSVKFEKLLEDSRCPSNVDCVWAGRASIRMIFTNAAETQSDTLALGDFSGTPNSDVATFGSHKIQLLEVQPAPVSTTPTPEAEYKVKLLITQ